MADSLLLEDSNSAPVLIVPILGLAGTGKTFVARVVYHLQRVVDHFDKRLWVEHVAGKAIYKNTGLRHDSSSINRLVVNLVKRLNGSKYLVVLEDFLEEDGGKWIDLLEPLLSASSGGKPGSKILVTSRSTSLQPDVLRRLSMAKGSPYLLGPLQQNEALNLFNSIAFRGIAEEDKNSHLIDIGLDIINKCGTNLSAIRIVASILSSEHTVKWLHFDKVVLESVERPVVFIHTAVDLIREADAHSWPFLAHLSFFPLGYKFNEVELLQLWEVQGFVHSVAPREKFNETLEELVTKGYLVKDKNCYYKAQVIMHEVVKHLVSDECCLVDKPTKEVDHDGVQRAGFIATTSWEAPTWLHCAKQLKSLFFLPGKSCGFITIPFTNMISSNLKALQALDLSIVNCKICPDSISALKHLRYLRLGISFVSLPECITKLRYLQTLDLRYTAIQELPESFHKLLSLRYFYTGDRLIDLPPNFAEMRELQTLDVFTVGQNNGLDILASFLHLAGKLKICYKKGHEKHTLLQEEATLLTGRNLQELSLTWSSSNREPVFIGDFDEKMRNAKEFEFLQPPPSVKNFAVQGWEGASFPQWAMESFSVLLKNLVSIKIADCYGCQHLPSFSSLGNLNSLQLQGLHALKWIDTIRDDNSISKPSTFSSETPPYFPSLKYLMLVNLPQLKGWSKKLDKQDQEMQYQILSHLCELRVSGCPKLMSMPLIPSIERLEVANVHEKLLKHLLNAAQEYKLLKELHIRSVHELESLLFNNISCLQVLTIRDCIRLKDISQALLILSSLMRLEIEHCEELDWGDSASWQVGDLESLRSLKLTSISKSCPLPKGLGCLTTLKELSFHWLYNVRFLPETIGDLTQLRRLAIQYLPTLVELPQSLGFLSALQHVEIRYCPRLKQLPESFSNLKCLRRLQIKECVKLDGECLKCEQD